jgi:hypothetical protein
LLIVAKRTAGRLEPGVGGKVVTRCGAEYRQTIFITIVARCGDIEVRSETAIALAGIPAKVTRVAKKTSALALLTFGRNTAHLLLQIGSP